MNAILKKPTLFMIEGIMLIILGTLSIALPQISTLSIGLVVGTALLIGGVFRFFRSIFMHKEMQHSLLSIVASILAVITGLYLLANLAVGILFLTFIVGLYFLVDGIFQISIAMLIRQSNNFWSSLLFSGIISLILASLVLVGLPKTAFWALGLLVGINLLTYGFAITFAAANAENYLHRHGV